MGLPVPWKTNWPSPDPRGGKPGWYASRDSVDSSNHVTTVVTRYQAVTRYWEIANEMENKKTRTARREIRRISRVES